ncbi:MAG TPA: glycosyltransferase, partial [Opitutaceae bacterium]
QRVARSLRAALGERALPVTHDPHLRTWRTLQAWETATLASTAPAAKRSAQWPLTYRLRARFARLLLPRPAVSPGLSTIPTSGLLVPELFSPAVGAALPALMSATKGPRAAIFHDAIALKFPELTPSKTVARFPAYLAELLAFDGIAAVSDDSLEALRDYWAWCGVKNTPALVTIPLGIDTHAPAQNGESPPPAPSPSAAGPVILSVGSIEGRKNHLALLEASEALWARGARFSLHLVGLAQPQTAAAALEKIRALQTAGRPLRYDGPVSEAALQAAYAGCSFTVYPSLIEGFGLPVLESVAQGRPCICSARGALGESTRGGGCLALDKVDAPSLVAGIAQLLDSPETLSALAAAARAREFRTWSDYAYDMRQWLASLSRR